MFTPDHTLSRIRQHCDSVVDDGVAALQETLTTEGEGDNEEARDLLARAVSAANALRHSLDTFYDFNDFSSNGAEAKEQPCLG